MARLQMTHACTHDDRAQKISKLRKWYDGVLQETSVANPFRNVKIEFMLKTMANQSTWAAAAVTCLRC